MQIKAFAIMTGTVALGLVMSIPSRAQGPMFDVVKVNLPYAVTVSGTTIQPGDYMIKELPSQDNSRVLVIYGDNGMKFETSAMTIPAYTSRLDKSEVTLHHIGNNYYFDKVWVQGKNYGYEFPLPGNLKEREKEQTAAVTVPATYQPPATATTTQNTPPPAPAPQEAALAPTPAPAPVAAEPEAAPAQAEIAQNTAPAPVPEANGEANREELPHTSAGWLMMLLSGGSLSGVGLMLRRRS